MPHERLEPGALIEIDDRDAAIGLEIFAQASKVAHPVLDVVVCIGREN